MNASYFNRELARVDQAEMVYINNNPFGDILWGRLTNCGPTMLCKISEDKGGFHLKFCFEEGGMTGLIY